MTAKEAIFEEMGWAEDGIIDLAKKAAGAIGSQISKWTQKHGKSKSGIGISPTPAPSMKSPEDILKEHDRKSHPDGYKGGKCEPRGRLAKQGFNVRQYDINVNKFDAGEKYDYDADDKKGAKEENGSEGAEIDEGKKQDAIAWAKEMMENPEIPDAAKEQLQKFLDTVEEKASEPSEAESTPETTKEVSTTEPSAEGAEGDKDKREPKEKVWGAVSDEEYEQRRNLPVVQEWKKQLRETLDHAVKVDASEIMPGTVEGRILDEVLDEIRASGRKVEETFIDVIDADEIAPEEPPTEPKELPTMKAGKYEMNNRQKRAFQNLSKVLGPIAKWIYGELNDAEYRKALNEAVHFNEVQDTWKKDANVSDARKGVRDSLTGIMDKAEKESATDLLMKQIDTVMDSDDVPLHAKIALERIKEQLRDPLLTDSEREKVLAKYGRLADKYEFDEIQKKGDKGKKGTTVEGYIEDGDENHRTGGVYTTDDKSTEKLKIVDPKDGSQITQGIFSKEEEAIEKIKQSLAERGYSDNGIEVKKGISDTRISINLPPEISASDAQKLSEAILKGFPGLQTKEAKDSKGNKRYVPENVFTIYDPYHSTMEVKIHNDNPGVVPQSAIINHPDFQKAINEGKLVSSFAVDKDGKPIMIDHRRIPHMLFAGATGAGKNARMDAAITSLMAGNSPRDVQFMFVDGKGGGAAFKKYNDSGYTIFPTCGREEAEQRVAYLINEMENRNRFITQLGAEDIQDYNKMMDKLVAEGKAPPNMPTHLPEIFLTIDEFGNIRDSIGKTKFEGLVKQIAAKGRSAGCHLFLATQKPTEEGGLSPTVKANITGVVGMRTANGLESKNIIDESGLEELNVRGPLAIKTETGVEYADGSFIDKNDILSSIENSNTKSKSSTPTGESTKAIEGTAGESTETKSPIEKIESIAKTPRESSILTKVADRISNGNNNPFMVPADGANATIQYLEAQGINYTVQQMDDGSVQITPIPKETIPEPSAESTEKSASESTGTKTSSSGTETEKQESSVSAGEKPEESTTQTEGNGETSPNRWDSERSSLSEDLHQDYDIIHKELDDKISQAMNAFEAKRSAGKATSEDIRARNIAVEQAIETANEWRQAAGLTPIKTIGRDGKVILEQPEVAGGSTVEPTPTEATGDVPATEKPELGAEHPAPPVDTSKYLSSEEATGVKNEMAKNKLQFGARQFANATQALNEAYASGDDAAVEQAQKKYDAALKSYNATRKSVGLSQLNEFGDRPEPEPAREDKSEEKPSPEPAQQEEEKAEKKTEPTEKKQSRRAEYESRYPQTREGQLKRLEDERNASLDAKWDELADKGLTPAQIKQDRGYKALVRTYAEEEAEIKERFPEKEETTIEPTTKEAEAPSESAESPEPKTEKSDGAEQEVAESPSEAPKEAEQKAPEQVVEKEEGEAEKPIEKATETTSEVPSEELPKTETPSAETTEPEKPVEEKPTEKIPEEKPSETKTEEVAPKAEPTSTESPDSPQTQEKDETAIETESDKEIAAKVDADPNIKALQEKVNTAKTKGARTRAENRLKSAKAQLAEALRKAATPESGVEVVSAKETPKTEEPKKTGVPVQGELPLEPKTETAPSGEQGKTEKNENATTETQSETTQPKTDKEATSQPTTEKKQESTPSPKASKASEEARKSLSGHLKKDVISLSDMGIKDISELTDEEAVQYSKAVDDFQKKSEVLDKSRAEFNKLKKPKFDAAVPKEERQRQTAEWEKKREKLEDAKIDAELDAQEAYDKISEIENSIAASRSTNEESSVSGEAKGSEALQNLIDSNEQVKEYRNDLEDIKKSSGEDSDEYRKAQEVLNDEIKDIKQGEVEKIYDEDMGAGYEDSASRRLNKNIAEDFIKNVDTKNAQVLIDKMSSPITSPTKKGEGFQSREGRAARKAFELLTGIHVPEFEEADIGGGSKSPFRLAKVYKNKISKIVNAFCGKQEKAQPFKSESSAGARTETAEEKAKREAESKAEAAKRDAQAAAALSRIQEEKRKAESEKEKAKTERSEKLEAAKSSTKTQGANRGLNAQSIAFAEEAKKKADETNKGLKTLSEIKKPEKVDRESAVSINKQLGNISNEIASLERQLNDTTQEEDVLQSIKSVERKINNADEPKEINKAISKLKNLVKEGGASESVTSSIQALEDRLAKDPEPEDITSEIRGIRDAVDADAKKSRAQISGTLERLRQGLRDLYKKNQLGEGNFTFKEDVDGNRLMGLQITGFKGSDGKMEPVNKTETELEKMDKPHKVDAIAKMIETESKHLTGGKEARASASRLVDAIAKKDADALADSLRVSNTAERKAFETLTGEKLPSSPKETMAAIDKFCGISPEDRKRINEEKQKKADEKVAQEKAEADKQAKAEAQKMKSEDDAFKKSAVDNKQTLWDAEGNEKPIVDLMKDGWRFKMEKDGKTVWFGHKDKGGVEEGYHIDKDLQGDFGSASNFKNFVAGAIRYGQNLDNGTKASESKNPKAEAPKKGNAFQSFIDKKASDGRRKEQKSKIDEIMSRYKPTKDEAEEEAIWEEVFDAALASLG